MGQVKLENLVGRKITLETNLTNQLLSIDELSFYIDKIRNYSSYYSSNLDIINNENILKNKEIGHNGAPNIEPGIIISMNSVAFLIVTYYFKCFDKNSKKRNYTLEKEIYKIFPNFSKIHEDLISFRNKIVAHDDNLYPEADDRKVTFTISDKKTATLNIEGSLHHFLSIPGVEIEKIGPLLDIMFKNLVTKKSELETIVYKKLIQNEGFIIRKLLKGNLINNEDFKNLK